MNRNIMRAFVVTGALASLCAAAGCVADRPSRNGVFDENQYLRKDFLIQPGSGGVDPGWFVKTTVASTSTPNPLAESMAGLVAGAHTGLAYVNFVVSADKLLMNNLIQASPDQVLTGAPGSGNYSSIGAQGSRSAETLDSWPITNVDLKYQVNLDGEKTNFYQENQELDWQQRQWVKLQFDKNDQSDLVVFGNLTNEFLGKCTDSGNIAASLTPNSFYVDEVNNYFQFSVDVTIPILFNSIVDTTTSVSGGTTTNTQTQDTFCASQFGYSGTMFQNLGRQNVTMQLMYSFTRAPENPAQSFTGPVGANTYMPLAIPEKDNIQKKYGLIMERLPSVDPNTGLWGSRQLAFRYDPKGTELDYYFAPGFPNQYKTIWGTPTVAGCTDKCVFKGGGNGIIDQTNALFATAKSSLKLVVKDYDADLVDGQLPRAVGDIRYNMLRWISDQTVGGGRTLAATQFSPDPRTGQNVSTTINFYAFPWQDYVLARLDYYEQSIGTFNFSAPGTNGVPSTCTNGQTIPLIPATVQSNHNGNSTLFAKMQQYLGRPVATWGNLGPSDFIPQHNQNFFDAFFTLLPYEVFGDPNNNPYVISEGGSANYGSAMVQFGAAAGEAQFQQIMSQIDHGIAPFDVVADANAGGPAGAAYLAQLQQATLAHRDYQYLSHFAHPNVMADDISIANFPGVFQRDARHCVNGQWETRDQYVANLLNSWYATIWWHEFGHSLGLDHNFMASIDRRNYPHYTDAGGADHIGLYASSVMDYNQTPDRVFWAGGTTEGGAVGKPGWAPYDQAAIAFIYSNSATSINSVDAGKPAGLVGANISGQGGVDLGGSGKTVDPTNSRWNDPLGYCPTGGTNGSGFKCTPNAETQFLYCTTANERYSPFCREFDFGTTPSEIIAAQIDDYEWQYLWNNFPQYHQYYSFGGYANIPSGLFTEGRRFLSSWAYDWSAGELSDTFRKLGVVPPSGVPALTYYNALTNEFNFEVSNANQLYAATSQALILQSSGQRPFTTKFDPYFGDTIQQGIAIDKSLSLQAFTALWPTDNYDQNQAQGGFISSFSFQSDPQYESVAESSVLAMIGGSYDMFAYSKPLGVQQFAIATHDTYFQNGQTGGRPEMKDWIGGYTFVRFADFLAFFRNLAVTGNTVDANGDGLCCAVGQPSSPFQTVGSCGVNSPNFNKVDTVQSCLYDPTTPATFSDPASSYHSDPFNKLYGPDLRRWIWLYLRDSNTWILADQDRNVGTYINAYNYTSDVLYNEDSGGGANALELVLKYSLNYFTTNGN